MGFDNDDDIECQCELFADGVSFGIMSAADCQRLIANEVGGAELVFMQAMAREAIRNSSPVCVPLLGAQLYNENAIGN